jgi:1-acyl-sn-glycerol-3-phosphate acyltransferase
VKRSGGAHPLKQGRSRLIARALRRLFQGVWHALLGYFKLLRASRWSPLERAQQVQAWAVTLLAIIGIRVKVQGQAPVHGPALLVANHISWLDITVIHATRHCRFISKSAVQHWPVIGRLASGADTLYLQRENRKDAKRMVQDMVKALQDGDVLAVFPEGTTSDGQQVLPFHANLLQAAIELDAPIQTVAIRYVDRASGHATQHAAYINDDTLVQSIWRVLSAPPMVVHVHFGEPQKSNGRNRRAWAADLRREIANDIGVEPRG